MSAVTEFHVTADVIFSFSERVEALTEIKDLYGHALDYSNLAKVTKSALFLQPLST